MSLLAGSSRSGDCLKKTLAKALTYRVLSLLVTATIGYVLTGSFAAALSFGLVDSVFKMGLYTAHEAAWATFSKKGLVGALVAMALVLAEVTKGANAAEGKFVASAS
jgi:uncharacterized membrane protein